MIKVYVMKTCPDCIQVKAKLQGNPNYEIIDISEHVSYLKDFMRLRDKSPEFESIKEKGSIGIPCFVFQNGEIKFSMEDIIIEEGISCSLDKRGC